MSEGQTVGSGWDFSRPWYHGSPLELERLSVGSTITQDRELARVFSHKPTLVSQDEDVQGRRVIKHSGDTPGYLYTVAEPVQPDDVAPHPTSSMAPGQEWITRRELRVELLGPMVVRKEERLTPEEINHLRHRLQREARPGG